MNAQTGRKKQPDSTPSMNTFQHDTIAALRREIHAHPELGFEEARTSDLVAAKLKQWGVPIHLGMAKTAVIGVVQGRDGGASGRAIGLRADMDALPVQEQNTFAHASQHPGVMHACGHDGHTAMLLAAAQQLAATPQAERPFDGTVYLIFQPAEEGRGGAVAMVEEGLFTRFPMQAVFGMHNWPGIPVGAMAASPGPVMAGGATFKITLRGKGAHAAMPHLGVDPMVVACHLVPALQTIVSRNKRPIDTAVLSVTLMNGGEATNVIPDTCTIEGTVRAFSVEMFDLVERRMRTLAEHISAAFDAQAEVEFLRRVGPVINHSRETLMARQVIEAIVGKANTWVQEPAMPSEDFAFMLDVKEGCYVFIGNGEGAHRESGHGEGPCMLHNPSYDFNDALIPIGAAYWQGLVQACLGTEPQNPRTGNSGPRCNQLLGA